jgi:magnesium-transporting ATPase (P-type)
VRCIMATGDNIHTAMCVAKKCNILQPQKRTVFAHQVENNENYEKTIVWQVEHDDERECCETL